MEDQIEHKSLKAVRRSASMWDLCLSDASIISYLLSCFKNFGATNSKSVFKFCGPFIIIVPASTLHGWRVS